MSLAGSYLDALRTWFGNDAAPEDAVEDPDTRAEVVAYLARRRGETCSWLLAVRAGGALSLAGYLALNALMTETAWPASALLLALGYAAANGAVCLGSARLDTEARGRLVPWTHAALDVGAVVALYALWGGAFGVALAPGVVLVGLLVLVLLVYTLLGHPTLSASLALASLGVAATAFYVVPGGDLAGMAVRAGAADASLRAYLLVEYLSIACLVTCLLALRLRRRLAAHRTELHRRLRARVEADLEGERRRHVESLNQLKRDFISVLSHELRNPVAPLLSSLEVMQQDARDGAAGACGNADLIDVAVVSARELQCLVNDYTHLAQVLTRPAEEPPRRNVPLAPMAQAVAARLSQRFAERPAQCAPHGPATPRFALEDLADCVVAADPPLLCAALRALLLRATRHTSGNAPVTVRGFSERGETGFLVHDPESHLDADVLDAPPNEFFAPTDERLYDQDATGLELVLARHALHCLGGRLDVESRPEHGTTVRCTLPLATDAHETVSEAQARLVPTRNLTEHAAARAHA